MLPAPPSLTGALLTVASTSRRPARLIGSPVLGSQALNQDDPGVFPTRRSPAGRPGMQGTQVRHQRRRPVRGTSRAARVGLWTRSCAPALQRSFGPSSRAQSHEYDYLSRPSPASMHLNSLERNAQRGNPILTRDQVCIPTSALESPRPRSRSTLSSCRASKIPLYRHASAGFTFLPVLLASPAVSCRHGAREGCVRCVAGTRRIQQRAASSSLGPPGRRARPTGQDRIHHAGRARRAFGAFSVTLLRPLVSHRPERAPVLLTQETYN